MFGSSESISVKSQVAALHGQKSFTTGKWSMVLPSSAICELPTVFDELLPLFFGDEFHKALLGFEVAALR
jgi:hypothetical protein